MLRKLKDLLYGEEHSLEERLYALSILVMAISFAVFILTLALTGGDVVGGFVVPFLIVLAYTVAIFIAATLVFRSKMKSI